MGYIVGTDEAGYGPNLGPLVVGATLWQVPDEGDDLYNRLQNVVFRPGVDSSSRTAGCIPVGDSKSLFQGRKSIATLERSVLGMLGATDSIPSSLFELFQNLARLSPIQLASETTYKWKDVPVPLECNRDDLRLVASQLGEELEKKKTKLLKMATTVLFPQEFNCGIEQFGNKANLLSATTCRLAKHLLDTFAVGSCQDVTILCDKHGGRAHYAGLLQQELTESFVRVVRESREESHYRWDESGRKFEIKFIARGEKMLPVALASMVAKYLRELSMNAWNLFWKEKLPALHPTAGYPQDAKRFKNEIDEMQTALNVEDKTIWRER